MGIMKRLKQVIEYAKVFMLDDGHWDVVKGPELSAVTAFGKAVILKLKKELDVGLQSIVKTGLFEWYKALVKHRDSGSKLWVYGHIDWKNKALEDRKVELLAHYAIDLFDEISIGIAATNFQDLINRGEPAYLHTNNQSPASPSYENILVKDKNDIKKAADHFYKINSPVIKKKLKRLNSRLDSLKKQGLL
jgi:hypothetical protein